MMTIEQAIENIENEEIPILRHDGFPNDTLIEAHIVALKALRAIQKMKEGKPYMYIEGCISGDGIYEIKADVWAHMGNSII